MPARKKRSKAATQREDTKRYVGTNNTVEEKPTSFQNIPLQSMEKDRISLCNIGFNASRRCTFALSGCTMHFHFLMGISFDGKQTASFMEYRRHRWMCHRGQ